MILEKEVFTNLSKLSARTFTTICRAALCVVGVAMLVSFPANNVRRFDDHFRAPEVRRSIERHTFFAQPELTGAEQIAHAEVAPTVLIPVTRPDFSKPLANFRIVSEIPLTRLLLRLKLGPARSGGSDPLS